MNRRGRVVGVVQARVGSTRLPRKVLLPLEGLPLVQRIIERMQQARRIDEVVLSTADTAENRPLLAIAEAAGVRAYAGREQDLADRFYRTGLAFGAHALVRVTGDCPLIDPGVLDELVAAYDADDGIDFVTNNKPPSFPHGLDAEVMSMAVVERIWREAPEGVLREWFTTNVTNNPDRFRIRNVAHPEMLSHHRWTVDYPEDYAFASAVFAELHPANARFSMHDILALLRRRPELSNLNAMHADHGDRGLAAALQGSGQP